MVKHLTSGENITSLGGTFLVFSALACLVFYLILLAGCSQGGKPEGLFALGPDVQPIHVASQPPNSNHVTLPSDAPDSVSQQPTEVSGTSGSGGGGSRGAATPGTVIDITVITRYQLSWMAGLPVGASQTGDDNRDFQFAQVSGIAVIPFGGIAVCDRALNRIVTLFPNRLPENICGTADGRAGYWGENIPAVASALDQPTGLAVDETNGVLYVADSGNRRIRYFMPGGRMYTLAGGGSLANDLVPQATDAAIGRPHGVALDSERNLYFSESDTGKIRQVAADGSLRTLATLSPGSTGSIAVTTDATTLWAADGVKLRRIALVAGAPDLDASPVWVSPNGPISALAYDQHGILYAATTEGAPALGGARIWTIPVTAAGALDVGREPEVIAGNGMLVGQDDTLLMPAVPLGDGIEQRLPGPAPCALAIDLYDRASPTVQSGDIWFGTAISGPPAWGQIGKLRIDS